MSGGSYTFIIHSTALWLVSPGDAHILSYLLMFRAYIFQALSWNGAREKMLLFTDQLHLNLAKFSSSSWNFCLISISFFWCVQPNVFMKVLELFLRGIKGSGKGNVFTAKNDRTTNSLKLFFLFPLMNLLRWCHFTLPLPETWTWIKTECNHLQIS